MVSNWGSRPGYVCYITLGGWCEHNIYNDHTYIVHCEVDDPWEYKYFLLLQTFHDIQLVLVKLGVCNFMDDNL